MGLMDAGDGIMKRTPLRLVEIAVYLEGVQGGGERAWNHS